MKMEVRGRQYADGTAERTVGIWYDDESHPYLLANLELDAVDARRFGEALIDAADEIDRYAEEDAAAPSAP